MAAVPTAATAARQHWQHHTHTTANGMQHSQQTFVARPVAQQQQQTTTQATVGSSDPAAAAAAAAAARAQAHRHLLEQALRTLEGSIQHLRSKPTAEEAAAGGAAARPAAPAGTGAADAARPAHSFLHAGHNGGARGYAAGGGGGSVDVSVTVDDKRPLHTAPHNGNGSGSVPFSVTAAVRSSVSSPQPKAASGSYTQAPYYSAQGYGSYAPREEEEKQQPNMQQQQQQQQYPSRVFSAGQAHGSRPTAAAPAPLSYTYQPSQSQQQQQQQQWAPPPSRAFLASPSPISSHYASPPRGSPTPTYDAMHVSFNSTFHAPAPAPAPRDRASVSPSRHLAFSGAPASSADLSYARPSARSFTPSAGARPFDEPMFGARPRPQQQQQQSEALFAPRYPAASAAPTSYAGRPSTAYVAPVPAAVPSSSSASNRPLTAASSASAALSSFARTLQLQRRQLEMLDDDDLEEKGAQPRLHGLDRPIVKAPAPVTLAARPSMPTAAAPAYATPAATAPRYTSEASAPAATTTATSRYTAALRSAAQQLEEERSRERQREEEREQLEHERTLQRLRAALLATRASAPLVSAPTPAPAAPSYSTRVSPTRAGAGSSTGAGAFAAGRTHSYPYSSSSLGPGQSFLESREQKQHAQLEATLARSPARPAPFASGLGAAATSMATPSPAAPHPSSSVLDHRILSTQERAARVLRDVDETLGGARRLAELLERHSPQRHSAPAAKSVSPPVAASAHTSTWARLQAELEREDAAAAQQRAFTRSHVSPIIPRVVSPYRTSPFAPAAVSVPSPFTPQALASSAAALPGTHVAARQLMAEFLHNGNVTEQLHQARLHVLEEKQSAPAPAAYAYAATPAYSAPAPYYESKRVELPRPRSPPLAQPLSQPRRIEWTVSVDAPVPSAAVAPVADPPADVPAPSVEQPLAAADLRAASPVPAATASHSSPSRDVSRASDDAEAGAPSQPTPVPASEPVRAASPPRESLPAHPAKQTSPPREAVAAAAVPAPAATFDVDVEVELEESIEEYVQVDVDVDVAEAEMDEHEREHEHASDALDDSFDRLDAEAEAEAEAQAEAQAQAEAEAEARYQAQQQFSQQSQYQSPPLTPTQTAPSQHESPPTLQPSLQSQAQQAAFPTKISPPREEQQQQQRLDRFAHATEHEVESEIESEIEVESEVESELETASPPPLREERRSPLRDVPASAARSSFPPAAAYAAGAERAEPITHAPAPKFSAAPIRSSEEAAQSVEVSFDQSFDHEHEHEHGEVPAAASPDPHLHEAAAAALQEEAQNEFESRFEKEHVPRPRSVSPPSAAHPARATVSFADAATAEEFGWAEEEDVQADESQSHQHQPESFGQAGPLEPVSPRSVHTSALEEEQQHAEADSLEFAHPASRTALPSDKAAAGSSSAEVSFDDSVVADAEVDEVECGADAEVVSQRVEFGTAVYTPSFPSQPPQSDSHKPLYSAHRDEAEVSVELEQEQEDTEEKVAVELDESVEVESSLPRAASGSTAAQPAVAPAAAVVVPPPAVFGSGTSSVCQDASAFALLRSQLRSYGVERFQNDMVAAGWFVRDGAELLVNTADKPFNPFARIVAGKLPSPYGNLLRQHGLMDADERFFVAQNRPELVAQWASSDPAWVGKASMAERHEFLLLRSLHWSTFNVLTFAIDGDADALQGAIRLLVDMRATARAYSRAAGWSANLGLFFHSHPLNSVQALHLHMLDLDRVGPTFAHLGHKNLPLGEVVSTLWEELRLVDPARAEEVQWMLSEDDSAAARSQREYADEFAEDELPSAAAPAAAPVTAEEEDHPRAHAAAPAREADEFGWEEEEEEAEARYSKQSQAEEFAPAAAAVAVAPPTPPSRQPALQADESAAEIEAEVEQEEEEAVELEEEIEVEPEQDEGFADAQHQYQPRYDSHSAPRSSAAATEEHSMQEAAAQPEQPAPAATTTYADDFPSAATAADEEFPPSDELAPEQPQQLDEYGAAPAVEAEHAVADSANAAADPSAVSDAPEQPAAATEEPAQGYWDEGGNWVAYQTGAPYYDEASGLYYDPASGCYWDDARQEWYKPEQAAEAMEQDQQQQWSEQHAAAYDATAAAEPVATDASGAYPADHAHSHPYEHAPLETPVARALEAMEAVKDEADPLTLASPPPPESATQGHGQSGGRFDEEEIPDEVDVDVSAELVLEDQPHSADVSASFDSASAASPQAADRASKSAALSAEAQEAMERRAAEDARWAEEMRQIEDAQAAVEAEREAARLREAEEEELRRAQRGRKKRELEDEREEAAREAEREAQRQAEAQAQAAAEEEARHQAEEDAAAAAAKEEEERRVAEELERQRAAEAQAAADAEAEAQRQAEEEEEAARRQAEAEAAAAAEAVAAKAAAVAKAEAEAAAAAQAAAATEAQAAEDARDAEIEAAKQRQLAAEAEAAYSSPDDDEEEVEAPSSPFAFDDGNASPTLQQAELDELDEEEDEAAAAAALARANAERERAAAAAKKEDMVNAITSALLQDLTRESLAPRGAASESKAQARARAAQEALEAEEAEERARVVEAKKTAKDLAHSAQAEHHRRRSSVEMAEALSSASAAAAAGAKSPHNDSEVEEESIDYVEDEIEDSVGLLDEANLPAPADADLNLGGTQSEFHINLAGVDHSEDAAAPDASGSFDTQQLLQTTEGVIAAATAERKQPAQQSQAQMAAPLHAHEKKLSPRLSASPPRSSHSSPVLSPRTGAPERDDRALSKQAALELAGRARLGDKLAERWGHADTVSMGAGMIAEEMRSISKNSSAGGSPVVSPRLSQRALLQRRERGENDTHSPYEPIKKLNLAGLLAGAAGAGTPTSANSSPRLLSNTASPRASTSPRALWTPSGSAAAAAVDKKVRVGAEADQIVSALTDQLVADAHAQVREVHRARAHALASNKQPQSQESDLVETASPEPESSPRDSGADAYDISHEDLSAPMRPLPQFQSHSHSHSQQSMEDSFELDASPAAASAAAPLNQSDEYGDEWGNAAPSAEHASASSTKTDAAVASSSAEEIEYQEEFDEFSPQELSTPLQATAAPSAASAPAPAPPGISRIVNTPAFARKYLRTVLAAAAQDQQESAHEFSSSSSSSAVSDADVHAGGGHGGLRAPRESVFERVEREQLYFVPAAHDEPSLPRAFVAASPSSPFPHAAQRAFHRLLFDTLRESVENYRAFWARNVHEPWFAHQRLLGTGLHTATAATAAAISSGEDRARIVADADDADEHLLPRIRTHMRQVGLERGVLLVAHEALPTRADESVEQAGERMVAKVALRVQRMIATSQRTPTLQQSLAVAAAHVAALTLGGGSAPPAPNVKLPSASQAATEHELAIVQRVLQRRPLHMRGLHGGGGGDVDGDDDDSSGEGVPALLDLSLDSSGEWDALEARESISIVNELADLLLADLLLGTATNLKAMQNSRSSSLFQEQMSAQLAGDANEHRRGRGNRRSPIMLPPSAQ